MDGIYKFKSAKLALVEGVFEKEMEKSVIKKNMLRILKAGSITGTLITDDGDTDEEESTVDIKDALGIVLCVGEEYFKVVKHDPKVDSEEEEEQVIHLVDVIEEGGWIIGKSYKRLNSAKVNSDEYVALKSSEVQQLPLNTDNYIEAHMSWIFDQLMSDFDERYGETEVDEDEEIDDGD